MITCGAAGSTPLAMRIRLSMSLTGILTRTPKYRFSGVGSEILQPEKTGTLESPCATRTL